MFALSDAHHHRPVLGVLLKLSSVAFLAAMAACVKYLGDDVPTGETIFVRGVVSVLVLVLIAWRTAGLGVLKTRNAGAHAWRSLSGTASMFCWFTALTLIPLADFTAISFTAPLFVTVLAMVLFGERIHAYRWTALAVGFLGVLIIIGPHLSFGSNALGLGVAFGAVIFTALAILFLRSMSGAGGEHALTITFYFSATSAVCAAFTALAGWVIPTLEQWAFMLAAGLLGVFGQLTMTMSYRYAEVSTIAPLDYSSLLFAVFFGYYFFGEVPHWSMWVGAPLVMGAGLLILWREYRRYAAAAPAPAVPSS